MYGLALVCEEGLVFASLKVIISIEISYIDAQINYLHTGIMDVPVHVNILQQTLLPFVRSVYPDGHCFTQDNDPKHTSKLGESFLRTNGINWWKTPPESSDLNPIENLWHELKEYLRKEVKPKNKDELVDDVVQFWD